MRMIYCDDCILDEPCVSCDCSYVDDVWHEFMCSAAYCPLDYLVHIWGLMSINLIEDVKMPDDIIRLNYEFDISKLEV